LSLGDGTCLPVLPPPPVLIPRCAASVSSCLAWRLEAKDGSFFDPFRYPGLQHETPEIQHRLQP
jgi:hypothetical protein